MIKKYILLICGGGGTEHDISLLSAKYIEETLLSDKNYEVLLVIMDGEGKIETREGFKCTLKRNGLILVEGDPTTIDYAIPCIHGPPGETGEIQSYLKILSIPYFGCEAEASSICFNKITTKLWLEALNLPVTPYKVLSNKNGAENIKQVEDFLAKHSEIFLKASSQGSSVGCFKITKSHSETQIKEWIDTCFRLSPFVLIEKSIKGRELEVAVYEWENKIIATNPGEIILPENPDDFYTFEEKYSDNSQAQTVVNTKLEETLKKKIKEYSLKAFKELKLRHLSRIDFFLSKEGEIYINEINTFPGMTPISMFPKMMEENGHPFNQYLNQTINEGNTDD